MRKFKDTLIALIFISLLSILPFYEMFISSGKPVNISVKELISLIFSSLLLGLIFVLYYRKARMNATWYVFILPLNLWIRTVIDSLKYNYHIYHTVLSIVGLLIVSICYIVAGYRYDKYKKAQASG